VSLEDGSIVSFPFYSMDKENVTPFAKYHYVMDRLILSKDKSFLISYVDIDRIEKFHVYSILKKELVWEGVLDLHGDTQREDPMKLMLISDDSINLFVRGENSKGVNMHSLYDGTIITQTKQLHKTYIL